MGDYLLIALMVATLGVLLWGVVGMARGADPEKQNKMMRLRVIMQGLALVVLVILFAVGR